MKLSDYISDSATTESGTSHIMVEFELPEIVRPAVYMYVSAHLDQQRRAAASAHFAAKVKLRQTSDVQERKRVQVDVVKTRMKLLEQLFFNGERHIALKDMTIADLEGYKAWVRGHELVPAERKIAQADEWIEEMRTSGARVYGDVHAMA